MCEVDENITFKELGLLCVSQVQNHPTFTRRNMTHTVPMACYSHRQRQNRKLDQQQKMQHHPALVNNHIIGVRVPLRLQTVRHPDQLHLSFFRMGSQSAIGRKTDCKTAMEWSGILPLETYQAETKNFQSCYLNDKSTEILIDKKE